MGCMVTWGAWLHGVHGYMVTWLHGVHGYMGCMGGMGCMSYMHVSRFTFHVSLHELQGEGGEPGFEVGVGVAIRSRVFMQG